MFSCLYDGWKADLVAKRDSEGLHPLGTLSQLGRIRGREDGRQDSRNASPVYCAH